MPTRFPAERVGRNHSQLAGLLCRLASERATIGSRGCHYNLEKGKEVFRNGWCKIANRWGRKCKTKINESVYTLKCKGRHTDTPAYHIFGERSRRTSPQEEKIIIFTFLWGKYLYVPHLSVFYGWTTYSKCYGGCVATGSSLPLWGLRYTKNMKEARNPIPSSRR